MIRCVLIKLVLLTTIYLFVSLSFGQKNKTENYIKHIDSAHATVDSSPEIARLYLDSIPDPIAENIKGKLADYYQLKALVNNSSNDQVNLYQNFLLAIKYAELEKNYDIAGMASLELFTNIYFTKKDSTAFGYLEKAKEFYTKSNNTNGLIEVMQMPAYVEFVNKNHAKSNQLILNHLDEYRAIKNDAYYHLFAVFMLTSNYINLEDFDNASKFRKEFESLKDNPTIFKRIFDSFEVGLNASMAAYYFSEKQIDSVLFYLEKNKAHTSIMNYNNLQEHYDLNAKTYKHHGNNELYRIYTDSLLNYQNVLLEKSVNAGLEINTVLGKSDKQLLEETKSKHTYRVLSWVFATILIGLIVFVILRYKKIKQKIQEFTKDKKEFSFLNANHEKLKVKVKGLEDYIVDVKKEIKSISTIQDTSEQRDRIKELYKDLHFNSATVLDKSKSHLELVNDLNIEFFNTINEKHPVLDESEIILCYYLNIGFKNKEIAVFLNKSIRSIENKRFRIGKKLNLKDKNISFLEYLNSLLTDNKDLA